MTTNQTQGPSEEAQAEAFFEALAGRNPAHGGATALRAAVLAQAAAAQADPSPQSERRDAETFAQLVREGVFAGAQQPGQAQAQRAGPSLLQRWGERLGRLLGARGFYPALATCAAVAALVVVVPRHDIEPPPDVLRGGPQNTLAVAEPAAYAQALAAELRAAGAQVRLVQINDQTWTLAVSAAQPDAAVALLQARGLQGITRLPADLTVRRQ